MREVWRGLRARGLRPWLDEVELVPGRDWQEELEKVVRTVPASAVLVGADEVPRDIDEEVRSAPQTLFCRSIEHIL